MAVAAAVERALAAVYARQPALQVAAAVTGGGGASAQLLFRPGSSSTMLQFSVPYARASLLEFLGGKETDAEVKFCSAETAQRMAAAAWRKAAALARKDGADAGEAVARFQLAVGVACTAALATNYAKKGPHEAFVSVCRATPSDANVVAPRCDTYHLTLDKTLGRSRLQEDDIVSGWLVYALARVAAVDAGSCDDLFAELTGELSGQDSFRVVSTQASSPSDVRDPLDSICGDGASSQLSSVCFLPDHDSASGKKSVLITQDFEFRGIVLPGSFNPLHTGHIDLALAAQRKWKAEKGRELPIGFEMAVANADKGSIAFSTVMERVKQFGPDSSLKLGEYPVLVTNATLFGQKAELLRNCVFVIGADTAVRIVDKKYYEDDEHRMVLALQRIADHGCSFVVAGRFDDKVSNSFISAESVLESHIPRVFRKLFVPLSESDYRNDISSTKLRQQAAAAAKAQQ